MKYVDIKVTGPGFNDVCSVVVQNIHDHNYYQATNKRVALAFPNYREGQTMLAKSDDYGEEQRLIRLRRGFFGYTIRLFGQQSSLQNVLAQSNFRCVFDNSDITVTALAQVPSDVMSAAFIRHKGMSKMTPSRLRRYRKNVDRLIAEGKKPKYTKSQLEKFAAESQQQALGNIKYPYVIVDSQTTECRFSIFVEKRTGDMIGDYAPDTYGFATNDMPFFLPDF